VAAGAITLIVQIKHGVLDKDWDGCGYLRSKTKHNLMQMSTALITDPTS